MFVIIVGGGNTGAYLAKLLLEAGHTLRVIEERPNVLEKLRAEIPEANILEGDGSSPLILEKAGVASADVLAAVTGSDETNLVVTSLARFEFKVPRVVARVNNPKNAWLFTREMGVDAYVNQADILGRLIAEEMSLGDMVTLLKLRRGEYSLVEEKVHPRSTVINRALHDLGLPEECVVVAIIRKHEVVIPRGHTVLQEGDEILALVHETKLQHFATLLSVQQTQT